MQREEFLRDYWQPNCYNFLDLWGRWDGEILLRVSTLAV